MSNCRSCRHWGAQAGEVAGLCLSPMVRDGGPLSGHKVRVEDGNGFVVTLPAGISLHREMMGPNCGAGCAGYSEKPSEPKAENKQ